MGSLRSYTWRTASAFKGTHFDSAVKREERRRNNNKKEEEKRRSRKIARRTNRTMGN